MEIFDFRKRSYKILLVTTIWNLMSTNSGNLSVFINFILIREFPKLFETFENSVEHIETIRIWKFWILEKKLQSFFSPNPNPLCMSQEDLIT